MKPPRVRISATAIAATPAVARVERWRTTWSRDHKPRSAPRTHSSHPADVVDELKSEEDPQVQPDLEIEIAHPHLTEHRSPPDSLRLTGDRTKPRGRHQNVALNRKMRLQGMIRGLSVATENLPDRCSQLNSVAVSAAACSTLRY